MLKNFVAVLIGVVLYKALNFALAPADFDFAAEALEAVVIAAIAAVVLALFSRWRGLRERSLRETA